MNHVNPLIIDFPPSTGELLNILRGFYESVAAPGDAVQWLTTIICCCLRILLLFYGFKVIFLARVFCLIAKQGIGSRGDCHRQVLFKSRHMVARRRGGHRRPVGGIFLGQRHDSRINPRSAVHHHAEGANIGYRPA